MEIRANYVLVGLATVLVAAACLLFVFWMGQRGSGRDTALYDIQFPRAGSGIGVGTDVLFLGVKVGSIKSILIDPENLSVRVRIEIDATTPIRTDTVATIEMRNIAGGSAIQLVSLSTTAPLLTAEGGQVPRIRPGVSTLDRIANNVPEILNSATSLIDSLNLLVQGENQERVANILLALQDISGRIANRGDDIDLIIDNLNTTMNNMNELSGHLSSLAGGLDAYIRTDLSNATRSFAVMAGKIDRTAENMSPGLERFANDGLDDLRRLIGEIRLMITTYERLGRRLESDPRRFLFGNPVPEYAP